MTDLEAILGAEILGYSSERADETFEELGVDSFDLINLRTAIETSLGRPIADAAWTSLKRPSDLHAIVNGAPPVPSQPDASPGVATRNYQINMPQMALGGLAEPWLFKEVGDFHWGLITDGLGQRSSDLADGNGDRLYATFTRFQIESSAPLTAYRENDDLSISGSIARYGAGIFLGTYEGTADRNRFRIRVMSSFAKRSSASSNKDLAKGQPTIPPDSQIEVLSEKPSFVDEYRARRNMSFNAPLFECDYTINPYHDINGVGLLYFAAYPSISDFCELKYINNGNRWAEQHSMVSRDICYFANSDTEDALLYSVLSHEEDDHGVNILSLISRKESRVPMALVKTRKVRTNA